MREMPVDDFFSKGGTIRKDGRMVHDFYVFQVKAPAASKGEWDLYELVATLPGDEAFRKQCVTAVRRDLGVLREWLAGA